MSEKKPRKKAKKTGDPAFAARLKHARDLLGIDGKELAKLIGLAERPATVSDWERAASTPSFENLQALSRALNVSTDWLVHGPAISGPGRPALVVESARLEREE